MDPALGSQCSRVVDGGQEITEGPGGPVAQLAAWDGTAQWPDGQLPEQSAGAHEDLPDVRVLSQQVRRLQLGLARSQAEAAGLRRALDTSRRIGIAVGILMARHQLTAEHAFDRLRHASQHQNVKLRDIAERVIYTGTSAVTD